TNVPKTGGSRFNGFLSWKRSKGFQRNWPPQTTSLKRGVNDPSPRRIICRDFISLAESANSNAVRARKSHSSGVVEMKRLFTIAALVALLCASAIAQTRGAGQATLIKNATVLTGSHGTLTTTDVLLRNGKIAAVGPNLNAPTGGRVIDGTGKFVLPGIIDAH